MKLYSKTAGKELELETMEKEQDGQILTVIKHASLVDVIYNQMGLCKDPDCIKIEDARPHSPYPVYRCTIWDKERERCAVGIGSGKPETLSAGIAANYADESASNRAFDRAAIVYLQFGSRQLSEEEVGIFLPVDLTASIQQQVVETPDISNDIIDSSPVEPIKEAPIGDFMNPPVEEVVAEEAVEMPVEAQIETSTVTNPEQAEAGEFVIAFGKYSSNPIKIKDLCATEEGKTWAQKCANMKSPNVKIADGVKALQVYLGM